MKLFIIGNGFDLAHGYKTSYGTLRKYLSEKEVMVGSFYIPDIFSETSDDDWNNFEELLEDYDFVHWGASYTENIYIDDDKEQDRNMSYNNGLNEYFREISNLLPQKIKKELCIFIEKETQNKVSKIEWIRKLFDEESFFINFNYSFLLENIYNISENKICHIHGTIFNEDEIVFGHGNINLTEDIEAEEFDLASPEKKLTNLNAKFKKNYQLQKLIDFLQSKVPKEIIIIGHSCGIVDYKYYEELHKKYSGTKWIFYYYDEKTKCQIERMIKTIGTRNSKLKPNGRI